MITLEEDGESLDEEDMADLPIMESNSHSSIDTNTLFRFDPLTQWQLVKSRSQLGVFAWRSVNLDPAHRYFAETSHCIRGPFQAQCAHYQIAHLRHRSHNITMSVVASPPKGADSPQESAPSLVLRSGDKCSDMSND